MRKAGFNVNRSVYNSRGLLFLAGLLVVAALGLTVVFFLQTRTARKEIDFRTDVLADLLGTLSAMQAAETGQRGFLLTQEEAYLEPYRREIAALHSRLDRLKGLAGGGQLPAETVTELELHVMRKLEELQRAIDLAQTLRDEEAIMLVKTGEGRESMNAINDGISRLAEGQVEARSQAQTREKEATRYAAAVFILGGVMNLVLLGWLYLCIRRASTA